MDRSRHNGSLASNAETVVDGHQERSLVGSFRQKRHLFQCLN